ncbi:MAG: zf-HC2 domain-containing protein [Candidatus Omnitrophica bacterium]|nr:zf-HC2 domain-containing protein [Candidatus Omnitrophota bacterium]
MDIGHVVAQLSAYLDEALSSVEMRDIEAHLRQCSSCTAESERMRTLVTTLRATQPVPPPVDLRDNVRAQLAQPGRWARLADALFRPWQLKLPLEAAGVLATAVLVVVVMRVMSPTMVRSPQKMAMAQHAALLDRLELPSAPRDQARVGKRMDELAEAPALEEGDILSRNAAAPAPSAAATPVATREGSLGGVVAFQLVVADPAQAATALAEAAARLNGWFSTREDQVHWVELPADQYAAFLATLSALGTATPLPVNYEIAIYQAEHATRKRPPLDQPSVIILLHLISSTQQ